MSEEKQPAEEEARRPTEAPGGRRHGRQREMEESIGELEGRVKELAAALEEKTQQAESREKESREFLEGWQRERAGFENYRRRTARELDDAGVVARASLIGQILPAIDNLERALGDVTEDAEVVRKGVLMTYEQLMSALQQQGLKEVPAKGEPFDPNVHEAIDAVEGTGQEPNTVVEDVQKGYTLGERLVRPARVRVAR